MVDPETGKAQVIGHQGLESLALVVKRFLGKGDFSDVALVIDHMDAHLAVVKQSRMEELDRKREVLLTL
jgi:hypothetical protein